jgi:phosphatidylinositol alpha-mannosyltransferase
MVENMRYIPLGVDLKKYKPVKKRQPLSGAGTRTIVYLGRVEKRKGSDLLLKAFAQLVKQMPATHLVIAGDGPMAPKLKAYVKAESVPNVHFPGYVSEKEKIRLLSNADLACFPSPYGEGYGIVILEAMATGTPMLAGNNVGYAQGMKGRGRIGLIDPEATRDFVNRLAVMLEDEELRKLMTSWELREVRQYDYPRVVTQYEQAYKDAIKNKDQVEKIAKKNDSSKYKQAIRRLSVRRQPGQ